MISRGEQKVKIGAGERRRLHLGFPANNCTSSLEPWGSAISSEMVSSITDAGHRRVWMKLQIRRDFRWYRFSSDG